MKTVAVHYHPDGYDTSRAKLMGRHAAGEEFLKALVRHGSGDVLYAYAEKKDHYADFIERVKTFATARKACQWISSRSTLNKAGCLFFPGPGLGGHAWQRRVGVEREYSLCGITHTTASHAVMDSLADLLIAPVQPWDALICTSQSVKDMVSRVLEAQSEYLKDRFRMSAVPEIPLQLPVIPLGVDCEKFAKTPGCTSAARQRWRQGLNIQADDIAVLFVGRLSFHAKAHPMPLYQSLEETSKRTKKTIHLIMAGWFANDAIKNAFVEAAKMFCPSVRVTFVDGRKSEVRDSIWYAADIFSSLSDNVQETFGLTPLEAMAAGLPVVISDWDGYRETARDGESGFLIPTWAPAAGSAPDIAMEHASGRMNYDNYIGYQSQFCAVDTRACTEVFVALVDNPELRQRMGIAGQSRARSVFDWSVIISQYEALWQELADRRKTGSAYGEGSSSAAGMPTRQDPTVLFQSYPSSVLREETLISPTALTGDANSFEKMCALDMNTFAAKRIVGMEEAKKILSVVSDAGPTTLKELQGQFGIERSRAIMLAVLWLSKMGLLRL